MKLKVCADYSFIAIAFCQAENCCHPVSENNKLFICTNCISTFTRDTQRSPGDLDRFIIALYPSLVQEDELTFPSVHVKKNMKRTIIKKKRIKMNLLEPSYPKDTGDIYIYIYKLRIFVSHHL